MMSIWALIKRNVRLFFKDPAMLLTSLITPLILLVLYATFLSNVYHDAFLAHFVEFTVEESLVSGLVGGQLFSSLLAVSCVTVAFCSNLLMVQDRVTGARADLLMTPVRRSHLAVAYFVASFFVTVAIALVATAASLIYVGCIGFYMSLADVLLVLLDVLLLSFFGTAFSSVVNYFLKTQGQMSAVGSIVSSCYGFVCGAYMPISSFSEGLRKVLSFLPGTYGTALLRNHAMSGALREMEAAAVPAELLDAVRDSVDCNIYFFSERVEGYVMYLVLGGYAALLFGAFVLINKLDKRKD